MSDSFRTSTNIPVIAKGWELVNQGKAIQKNFVFESFSEAFSFITEIALLAERLNHHPEWSNCYHLVTLLLTTHEIDGLSNTDIQMAQYINKIFERFSVIANPSPAV